MKKHVIFKMLPVLLGIVVFLGSCDDDDDDKIKTVEVTMKVLLPDGHPETLSMEGIIVTVVNKTSGTPYDCTMDASGTLTETIEEGVYDFRVNTTVSYEYLDYDELKTNEVTLVGLQENVPISRSITPTATIAIQLSGDFRTEEDRNSWVIKEIYFAGTKTSANVNYQNDQYIEIHNNSTKTLYADGLSLGETRGVSTASTGINYWASTDSVYVQTYYTIPGDGTTYPVAPGKSILIAPQPVNHQTTVGTAGNPDTKLQNLASADFQWYDAHATLSIDVPEVPNMIKYYSYSATVWLPSIQGNRAYIIFNVNGDGEQYVLQNSDFRRSTGNNALQTIKVHKDIIFDAVELGHPDDMKVKNLPVILDSGNTYWNGSRSGECVRRKVERTTDGGRVIYQDTNNSTNDFEIGTPAPKQQPLFRR